ncbi:MAG TPA: DUF1963 domain-containing protein [Prosthecobacter sp.]
MVLLSDEELKAQPEFDDLEAALEQPQKVTRLRIYRQPDAPLLSRVVELPHLQTLSISLSDVHLLLPGLGHLPHLQSLSLQACNVTEFPESVFQAPALKSLSLGNNQMKRLPQGWEKLSRLEYLNLSQNELTGLPETLCGLDRLRTLVLSYNRLEVLPDALAGLSRLESLYLTVNRLRALPETLGDLASLEVLHLDFNRLTHLPASIENLADLRSISLENNLFVTLPQWLGQRPDLEVKIEAAHRQLFMDWSYRHSPLPVLKELQHLELHIQPGSELQDGLEKELAEAGLESLLPKIARCSRDAISLETLEPDDCSVPGTSRFGGFPDLPSPDLFPQSDGLYWSFLAQINLADVAPFNRWLPRSGLLSFFMDSSERLNGRVLFFEDELETLATVRHTGAEEMLDATDDYTEHPHHIGFRQFACLPEPRFIRPKLPDEESALYDDWQVNRPKPEHAMNGHTFTQHESPQEQAANALRGMPEEWVPLLRLGWDSKVGFQFWDAGTVTFCIHQEDLRRGDFTRVHLSLESS